MRRGNISNVVSPAFMFNVDTLLFIEEKKSMFETLEQAFFSLTDNMDGLFYNRKLSSDFIGKLSKIYYDSDYNVYLVSTDIENKERYTTLLKNKFVPYNKILFFNSIIEVREFVYLHAQRIHYYIDSDPDNIRIIGDRGLLYSDIKKIYY